MSWDRLASVGRIFFAASMIGFGAMNILWQGFVTTMVPPWPSWVPGRSLWACLVGVVLIAIGAIAGGLGLVVEKTKRWAALLSGGMIFTWFVILHIPRALAAPHDTNEWSSVCESLAVSGMAFLLAATSSTAAERTPDAFPA